MKAYLLPLTSYLLPLTSINEALAKLILLSQATKHMQQFLLLLNSKASRDISPEELERRLSEYREWVETISDYYISDSRLEQGGAYVAQDKPIMTDGPFAELNEVIAGFVIIKASHLNQAAQISQTSPLLQYFDIAVRPIAS